MSFSSAGYAYCMSASVSEMIPGEDVSVNIIINITGKTTIKNIPITIPEAAFRKLSAISFNFFFAQFLTLPGIAFILCITLALMSLHLFLSL